MKMLSFPSGATEGALGGGGGGGEGVAELQVLQPPIWRDPGGFSKVSWGRDTIPSRP